MTPAKNPRIPKVANIFILSLIAVTLPTQLVRKCFFCLTYTIMFIEATSASSLCFWRFKQIERNFA
jgi:hypothetical protein